MSGRLDLNGQWDLAFDLAEQGARLDWITGGWPEGESQAVEVPSVWNITHPDKQGIGYYRRKVEIPAAWPGRAIRLHVEGACYRLEAWVNGIYAGSHQGAYTPFWLDATNHTRPGEINDIVLRVTSLSRARTVDGMLLQEMPVAKQSWYYAEGGLWGNVWLEAVPTLFCESIAVEPNLRREMAAIEVGLNNLSFDVESAELLISIVDPRGEVVYEQREPVSAPPAQSQYFFTAQLSRALAWSCEEPNLYRAELALLKDGVESHRHGSNFGMRDFTVLNGQFLLNDAPIYIQGALLQPNYPVGLLAPVDRGMLQAEVRLAKEAGFNLIRVHIRPSVPGLLDLTDRLGMLVYAETSLAWIQESPRLLDHARRELTALIERDRNHPSIVFWGIFNEHRRASSRYADTLIRTARSLDATRVIVDNSGGSLAIDQDFGWLDRATVVPNRLVAREPIQDVHIYIGAPVPKKARDWLREIGTSSPSVDLADMGFGAPELFDEWQRELRTYQGQVFVSELGCGGMGDLDEMVAGYGEALDLLDAREFVAFRDSLHEGFRQRGLVSYFGSVRELIRQAQRQQALGNRRQIEAVLTNPRISGYTVTQLNDVCCEFHAGLLDIWRRPKEVFYEYKRLQQDRVLIVETSRATVATGQSYGVNVTLVDRVSVAVSDQVTVSVSDQTGRQIQSNDFAAPAGTGIKPLGSLSIQGGDCESEHRLIATIAGDAPCRVEETVLILQPEAAASGEPADHLGDDRVVTALQPGALSSGEWGDFFAAVDSGSVGIVGDLKPDYAAAIEALSAHGFEVQLSMGLGAWIGCYHWIGDSPLFEGLPSGQLATEVYAEIIPRYVLSELGGEVLAGTLSSTQTRLDAPKMLWYSDIEIVRLGQGRLIFCQYRLFDGPKDDPVVNRLRNNLMQFAHSVGSAAT
jgi:hypothetical protein